MYGPAITQSQQVAYNTFLSTTAHSYNLSIGLINALSMTQYLVPIYDFGLVEGCMYMLEWYTVGIDAHVDLELHAGIELGSCLMEQPFLTANKLVLGVEYELK